MTSPRQVNEGELLWQPTPERVAGARLTDYMRWLRDERGIAHDSYDSLWQWSVDNIEAFWASIWDYFGVIAHTPYRTVLAPSPMGTRVEGAHWFEGATLNYAEHCLRRRDDHVAVIAAHESGSIRRTTFAELAQQVGIQLRRTEMPNASPAFIEALADVVLTGAGARIAAPAS